MASDNKTADVVEGEGVFILKPGTRVFIKTKDVCAITGKSNQWIGQLVTNGVLNKPETSHGNIYFELIPTMRAYVQMLEARIQEQSEDEKDADRKKKVAEAKLKQAKAAIATMDARERAGKMHRSEDVAAMTEDLIYTIRGGLLALPGRLAVDIISAKDAAEASEIIRREVYILMEELAAYKYDPVKYQERVRERMKLEAADGNEKEDDE